MKLFISFIFINIIFILYPQTNPQTVLNKAIELENNGKNTEAIEYYKKYILLINDNDEKEKISLKIPRLIDNIPDSIEEYKNYLLKFPKSRYRFLARFELANLYSINKSYKSSLSEYYNLSNISKGTAYWQKSLIEASKIEIILSNIEQAMKNLYNILNEIDDYEDIGTIYFYLGVIYIKQNSFPDAEQYFLMCAGSFPQCSKSGASLNELMNIYILEKKYNQARTIARMIEELYTDSFENLLAKKTLNSIEGYKSGESDKVNLINLNDDKDIKDKSMARLKSDLELSIEIKNIDNTPKDKSIGYYVQLRYFSQEEFALKLIDICKSKNVKYVFIKKSESSSSGKVFYRVLSGPYNTEKQANEKLIEFKENNLESIVIKLM
jgi:tetratricopeptide (TPR) repeat protein